MIIDLVNSFYKNNYELDENIRNTKWRYIRNLYL